MKRIDSNEIELQKQNEETTKMKFITPVLQERWRKDFIVMEYYFGDGRIAVDEYNITNRGERKKADYVLLGKGNCVLAVVEAKAENESADKGYGQAIDYASILDAPFAYATNGKKLIEKDMLSGKNRMLEMKDFPTYDELHDRFILEENYTQEKQNILNEPYYYKTGGKIPRYYQRIAINRTVEAVAKGQKRILLVMATGTGKTFTAFQIIWRLWKSKSKKKILFLADRDILISQTIQKDFAPFGDAMIRIDNANINTSREIYLSLYQQLQHGENAYYKQLPSDFFDLIIVDECHRSSANPESNWHDILTYFGSATQIGLTATPKETGVEEAQNAEKQAEERLKEVTINGDKKEIEIAEEVLNKAIENRKEAESNSSAGYFGNPIYTYSLKQGIDDGFLSPYKVISVELDIDKDGYRPEPNTLDVDGKIVEDRLYFQSDFDRKIVVEERRKLVAKRISDYLKANDRYAKTIVFCEDISHCEEMVRLLENENTDLVAKDHRYIMQITGDNPIGKAQLDNFVDPSVKYPVIAVTSRLMSTGVDAETCENIVLDRTIGSMTEFKQIVGRGTRVKEKYELDNEIKSKRYFTILDFRKNYLKFLDPSFDGDPVTIIDVSQAEDFPKTPEKPSKDPTDETYVEIKKEKKVRVNGISVSIVGEEVKYLDEKGKLTKQNLRSCVQNNIVSLYPNYEDFYKAWIDAKDKTRFAEELLLDDNWEKRFIIEYGYSVDNFDIIRCIGYGQELPVSKHQRSSNVAIAMMMENFSDKKKKVVKALLDSYAETNFDDLRDVKNIFSMPKFHDEGFTPLGIIKEVFGGKDKYLQFLDELERKLYE